jgi:rRNA-processing protein FCF1
MSAVEIPSDSVAIIDSSVLFAMGGPSNEKYQAFERFVRTHNITVTVPEQVVEELWECGRIPERGIRPESRRVDSGFRAVAAALL